jgi:hypothetical protein
MTPMRAPVERVRVTASLNARGRLAAAISNGSPPSRRRE